MLPHRVKVPVIVQQRDPILDAVSADDQIATGRTVIPGSPDDGSSSPPAPRCRYPAWAQHRSSAFPRETHRLSSSCAPRSTSSTTMSPSSSSSRPNSERSNDLTRHGVAEVRDPDRAVDRDDSGRSRRIASRSPSQPMPARLRPSRRCRCRLDHTSQCLFHRGALGGLAGGLHRFAQQPVVDLDVRAHRLPSVYSETSPYTRWAPRSLPPPRRRPHGEVPCVVAATISSPSSVGDLRAARRTGRGRPTEGWPAGRPARRRAAPCRSSPDEQAAGDDRAPPSVPAAVPSSM